jgi:hypothetical protein
LKIALAQPQLFANFACKRRPVGDLQAACLLSSPTPPHF